MRTTAGFLLVALVALAACAGGASADQHQHKKGHHKNLMERHTAKHEAAMEHIADAAARHKAVRAAVHEAAKEHVDAAHERFKQAMTNALKAMSDAAAAWHEHVQETTEKYQEMHADLRDSVNKHVDDAKEHKVRRERIISRTHTHIYITTNTKRSVAPEAD